MPSDQQAPQTSLRCRRTHVGTLRCSWLCAAVLLGTCLFQVAGVRKVAVPALCKGPVDPAVHD